MFINAADEAARIAIKNNLPERLHEVIDLCTEAVSCYAGNDTRIFQNIIDRDGDWPSHESRLSDLCTDLVTHIQTMNNEWRSAYRRDVAQRNANMVSQPPVVGKIIPRLTGEELNEHRLTKHELI